MKKNIQKLKYKHTHYISLLDAIYVLFLKRLKIHLEIFEAFLVFEAKTLELYLNTQNKII